MPEPRAVRDPWAPTVRDLVRPSRKIKRVGSAGIRGRWSPPPVLRTGRLVATTATTLDGLTSDALDRHGSAR